MHSTAYAIQEKVSPGLAASDVSHGGLYPAHINAIRWGPFLDNEPRELTYRLIGADAREVIDSVAGVVSFDGHDIPIREAAAVAALRGDADGDGDIDVADYVHFVECFSAAETPIAFDCDVFDFDGDGNVGLADLVGFQTAFTGARQREPRGGAR